MTRKTLGVLVVVLGLVAAGLWVLLRPDHRTTSPVDLATEKVKACETATPDALLAAHKPENGVIYADVKCRQDRYTLAMMRSTQIESNDVPALFEYKADAWRFVNAQTDMPCGEVPKDVWKSWDFPCLVEPVVCRDAGDGKVIDVDGVGCPAAIDIADRYRAAINAQQAQGQGLLWESGEWSCSWPYEDGYAHAQVPQKCVRTTDDLVVQLGEYPR